MAKLKSGQPPRWVFAILTAGAFLASGIYLGMIRVEGAVTGDVIRASAFGALGLLMLWAVMAKRQ